MAGIFDPKFIKDGNVTANLSFLATIKLPSLTSESSSLDFLSIAADNSIKKRSLGTMALLSAANFYDKTTADGTFLKLTGGVMSGTLTVNAQVNVGSTLNITGSDLTIRNAARGVGGRALVHDPTNGLTVNYGDDFTGGVRIGSNVFFSNTASSYLLNVNMGFGTATPSEKVSVLGNISMIGMFKLNASFGTTGQFIKNTGTLSEWANITPADITGLYLGTKTLMEDTRTSFGNGIYTYRTYNGQTNNNPTGLFYGQILNWGGGVTGGQAQVAIGWTPSDNNYIAFRSLRDNADNWYSWKRIYHEGYKPTTNDITGLATYNGLTNYLPLSGGTLSGTLTVPLIKISKSPSDTIEQGPSVYLNGGIGTSYTQLQQGIGRFIIFGFGGSSWEEKMTIRHSDGFVGIGTPNPIYRLDVNGTARFTGNVNFNTHLILNNDRWIYWKDTSGADRRFLALSTNNSFYVGDIDNAISGGVNNFFANQYHNFFVNNDLKITIANGFNYFKGSIQAYGVLNTQIRTDSAGGIAGKIQSVDGNSVWMGAESNHTLNLITNNIIRGTFDIDGNFGIGITTPSSLGFQIHKGSLSAGITLSNSANNWSILTGNTTNAFIITDNQWGERMRISSSGYVGIGATNPQTKLNIGGGYGQLNGLAIGLLDANEYSTLLFTENYGNGVTHLFSLKQTVGYGDLALAEYGGRVGIGTDRPNVKLDVRGTIRIGNNGFVTGSSGSFMDIWHTSSTGNSQVNLQAWSNGGNTYDSIALQPLSGEVRIGTSVGGYNLNVGGNTRIDGYLRIGDNIGLNNNKYIYWKDTTGVDRRFIGFSDGNTLFFGDIDRSITNSNSVFIADTLWFYCGQANKAVITSSGLDVKGNYYQNGVLKTFFDGNYNSLSNLPNLGNYVPWANVEMALNGSNWNDTNGNPISIKMVKSIVDGKSSNGHTHDYYTLTNRPDLGSFLTWGNVVTDLTNNWNDTNNNPLATKLVKVIADGKSNNGHSHDYYSLTNRPNLFDGNYNNLSYRPDLSAYLTQASVVTDNANVNVNNLNPISTKLVYLYINDLWGAVNSKANASHTHDYYSLTNRPNIFDGNYNSLSNRPDLSGFLTWANVETGTFSTTGWNDSNTKATSVRYIKPLIDDLYGYISGLENSKSDVGHTHDYNTLTNKPDLGGFLDVYNDSVTGYTGRKAFGNLYIQGNLKTHDFTASTISVTNGIQAKAMNISNDLTVNGSLFMPNPAIMLSNINTTSIEGVYVKSGNYMVKLTLTQFKNLMATV